VPFPAVVNELIAMTASLTDRSLRAVKWNYVGVSARILSQLVAQITLARLLGPEPFGLFAAAFLLISVGGIFVEMGLGSALVQSKQLTEDDVCFVFTRVLVVGSGGTVAVFALAEVIGWFFANSSLVPVIQGVAPVLLLQALGVVSQSLLRRDLNFKAIQVAQVSAYSIGFIGVGVGMALLGAGVWSLVVASIAQAVVAAIIMYVQTRHSVTLRLSGRDLKLSGFGIRVLICSITNWIIENVDKLLVGKILGVQALGLYSVSYYFVRTPANHLMTTLQAVLLATCARDQNNVPSLQRAYLTVIAGVALMAFPVFAGVATVSDTVVDALFGRRWVEAGPVLLPLALSMIVHTAMTGSVILWATDRVQKETRVQGWVAIAFVPVLMVAAQSSLIVVAWAVFFVYVLRATWLAGVILRSLDLSWWQFYSAVKGGIVLAVLVSAILWGLNYMLALLGVGPIARLGCEIATGAAVVVLCNLVFRRFIMHELLYSLIRNVFQKK
jgi:O-antigen/teichoic acid export membrane protein